MTEGTFPKVDGDILYASEVNGFNTGVTLQISPIGSVVAWLKNLGTTHTPALPSDWVECNGQVLSDATSVYNGQTIPDLNGTGVGNHRFLRGQNTSGGTGTVGATGSVDVTYYEVVWIMRIK
jgi:hypothetical protein